jgi:hypothetical protein
LRFFIRSGRRRCFRGLQTWFKKIAFNAMKKLQRGLAGAGRFANGVLSASTFSRGD